MVSSGMKWKSALLLLIPIPIVLGSLFIGTYPLPPDIVMKVILAKLASPLSPTQWSQVYETVLFDIRLPRIILALLGGIALSVSEPPCRGYSGTPWWTPTYWVSRPGPVLALHWQ